MKPVCCLFAATLGLVVTLGLVRADSSDPNQPINPYTQTDANGTPLGVLNPNLMPLSDEEKQELQKERDREQEKAALDKDWLVRYYEQAVQSHPGENLDTSNIYYEFSTNPELAKLAGMPELAAYGAAKAGVAGLVRGLAAELADSGVTANAVSPGSTDTPILEQSARLYGLEGRQAFAHQQPVGRLLSPDEVAAALVWLAGPDSRALTGAVIPVDGGLSL